MEMVYGSSLDPLLLSAAVELTGTYVSITVVFESSDCSATSFPIYCDSSITSDNTCLIIAYDHSLHADYTGTYAEALYNFRKDLYDIISNDATSIKQNLVDPNEN